MEKWFYKQGVSGASEADIPQLAGKTISGRIYYDGIQFRPVTQEPVIGKQFLFINTLGKLKFAFPFDDNVNLDIPYKDET